MAYGRFLARQAKLPVFAIMASKHSVESRKRVANHRRKCPPGRQISLDLHGFKREPSPRAIVNHVVR